MEGAMDRGLPEDLKHYGTGDDGFQLIDQQTAGEWIFIALLVALLLERVGVL